MKFHICLSETNKKLGGVCGGIAQCFHFEPSIVRIIFVLLVLLFRLYPIAIYMVLWAILPKEY
ncbi:MAG: PspC domain-containing protein [Firmicutes bacterium]|jgi:phage shock protein PspC (stress-responsive transcriptional regulator)|nr:PspC domain-containing protein [Bacillota bacterium]